MEQEKVEILSKELQLENSGLMGPVTFHGSSMRPFLWDGDEIFVVSVKMKDVKKGDIITYRFKDRFPTYRVVEKRKNNIFLKGDNWPNLSFRVWEEDILGRVVSVRRGREIVSSRSWRWVIHAKYALGKYYFRKHELRLKLLRKSLKKIARERWIMVTNGYRGLPHIVFVCISSQCNADCLMCPYRKARETTRFMEPEALHKILPIVKLIRRVKFTGFGEPLFNKNLLQFIQMTKDTNPATEIEITTNGSLLTEAIARELVRLGVYKVVISMDGATAETVEKIRRGIKFSDLTRNILNLHKEKERAGSPGPIIRVNYAVGYGNYREMPDLVELSKKIGIEEIKFLEMQPGSFEDYKDNLFNSMKRDSGKILKEAIKLADRYGIKLFFPMDEEDKCDYFYVPHISEDGEVFGCAYLCYDRRLYRNGKISELPNISFGNLNQSDFKSIWNSREYRRLRRICHQGRFPTYCEICYDTRIHTAREVKELLY